MHMSSAYDNTIVTIILLLQYYTIVMVWMSGTVERVINGPCDLVYDTYYELTNHPKWSPWIVAVTWTDREATISDWRLKKLGFSLSWTAHNTFCNRPFEINWESITGLLPNAGTAKFEQLSDKRTTMCLTVRFNLPAFIAFILGSVGIDRIVRSTLTGDLERFNIEIEKLVANMNFLNSQITT